MTEPAATPAPDGVGAPRSRWQVPLGSLAAAAVLLAALTAVARVTGFLRWTVFSGTVGSTCTGSAYATANLLPNVLYEVLVGGAAVAAVIPLMATAMVTDADTSTSHRGSGSASEVDRTASALLTWALLVLTPAAVLLALLARPLSALLLGANDDAACGDQVATAAALIVIFAPQVVLYGVGAVLTGVLQAHQRFVAVAVAPLLSSLVVIAAYLGYAGSTSPNRTFWWLGVGTTAGVAVLTLPLLIPVTRRGIRLRPQWRFPEGMPNRVRRLAAAGLAGVVAQQMFFLVAAHLANARRPSGGFVVLGYAQAVAALPHALLAVPIVTATFPRVAARVATVRSQRGPNDALRDPGQVVSVARQITRSTRAVLAASAVGAAVLAAEAPAVAAVFTRLDVGSVDGLGAAVVAAAPSLIGLALVLHLSRVLMALDHARAAGWTAVTAWSVSAFAAAVAASARPPRDVVLAISGGQSVGLVAGAMLAWLLLRHVTSPVAVAGQARTAATVLPGALLGGWLGHRAAVGVLGERTGWGWIFVAGVLAAATAAAVVLAAVAIADRGLWRAVTGTESRSVSARSDEPGPGWRVLLVMGPTEGGIGRHVAELAAGLAEAGVAVEVAAPGPVLERFGLLEHGIALPMSLGSLRSLRRMSATRDVVHAHGLRIGALSVLACVGTGTPLVVTVHNAGLSGGATGVMHGLLERIVARGAAQILVVSNDLGARMRALGARNVERALVPAPPRSHPQNAGPDGAAHRPDPGSSLRAEYRIPDGHALVVTVARLAPQKGLSVWLEALAQLHGEQLHALIAGEGPLRADLVAQAERDHLPVHFLGARNDVPALFAAADLVVVPSLWEGQPLVVQEALAAGTAIVATDAGGTREVCGDAAVLVPPGDPAPLADAVRSLLHDPGRREQLRAAARERARGLPDQKDALNQVLGRYQAVVADSLESRGRAQR